MAGAEDDVTQELLLRLDVAVDARRAEAERMCDVAHSGGAVAAFGEELEGSLADVPSLIDLSDRRHAPKAST